MCVGGGGGGGGGGGVSEGLVGRDHWVLPVTVAGLPGVVMLTILVVWGVSVSVGVSELEDISRTVVVGWVVVVWVVTVIDGENVSVVSVSVVIAIVVVVVCIVVVEDKTGIANTAVPNML